MLGNEEPMVSGVGEVLSAAEFYDYDAKYNNSDSRTVIPAEVEEEKTEEMRRIARKIFRAVDGSGLARVDFFIDKKTGRVLFNELNTMPGFTPISMYPMLWVQAGMTETELMGPLHRACAQARFGHQRMRRRKKWIQDQSVYLIRGLAV